MHDEAYRWIGETISHLPRPVSVLELGSRNINGTPRPLFQGVEEYIGVDVQPGPGVDIVADGVTYVHWEPCDLVLCCEVLEHTHAASALVANAVTLATPGGHVLITCATSPRAAHSAIDGGPLQRGEHYQNIDIEELLRWLVEADAEILEATLDPGRGDLYVLARVP